MPSPGARPAPARRCHDAVAAVRADDEPGSGLDRPAGGIGGPDTDNPAAVPQQAQDAHAEADLAPAASASSTRMASRTDRRGA